MSTELATERSGIPGLDELLCGGFVRGRMYLLSGPPGSGKTLLGMHFLENGLQQGQTTLAIHGEESQQEILANGRALGIDLDGTEFLDLGPESDVFAAEQTPDLVDPGELERDRHLQVIHDTVSEIDPDRIVIDPITQLRYLEPTEYQYRKRILSFVRFLKERNATVLTTATSSTADSNLELRSLSDGIIELLRDDGGRRVTVTKHRGRGQRDGDHGMEIRSRGLEIFPSLIPNPDESSFTPVQFETGVTTLDELLGGGIEQGTVTFISGPTGVGKTTLATQVVAHIARTGNNSAVYLFEESAELFTHRSESLGIPVGRLRDDGKLILGEIEPLAHSAEEFARQVLESVTQHDIDAVLIDGIDGYTMSIQGQENQLVEKLHALTRKLTSADITVFITDERSTVTGITSATRSNLSYVADNILSLSYVESNGELRRILGVLKKRASGFDPTFREFELTENGIQIGASRTDIGGVLQKRQPIQDSTIDD